jgi:hypothetical protein
MPLNTAMQNVILYGCMLLLSLRAAGGPLEDLQSNFQTRCDFAEAARDQQLEKLDASYLAALDRQVEKTRTTGNLDAIIPFINEAQAVKTAKDPLPELPEDAPPELKQMRVKHAEARAKILNSHAEAITALAAKMEAALKARETELTKAGNIDDALAAKKMRENLEKNAGVLEAKDLIASRAATQKPGDWISLFESPMTVLNKGLWEVAVVSKSAPENKPYQGLIDLLKNERQNPDQVLMAIPNAVVEFKPDKHVTQIRGKMSLKDHGGSVHFKVFAGDAVVAEKIIRGEAVEIPFDVRFPATKSIRLETNVIENDSGDLAVWINPEVR